MKFLAVFMVVIVLALIAYNGFTLAKGINIPLFKNDCKISYNEVGDRNIILRMDDVQAEMWRDIQIKMVEDALDRDKTLSLGVIPFNLFNDRKMSKFLMDNRCNVEISLHGYTHDYTEFKTLSFEEADDKIKKGLKILNKIEPNVITFIPPENVFSEGTEQAVFNNSFEVLSAEHGDTEYSLTQSTYDWASSELEDYRLVLSGCKNDLDNNKTCIIMLHPQDYAANGELDEKKYDSYIKLLEGLDELDANVITFRDLVREDYAILN